MEGLDSIEAKEQTIIQHIRTSGLKSAREISLVEEILDLRKDRRRWCSALLEKIQILEQRFAHENERFENERNRLLKDFEVQTSRLHAEISQRDEAFRALDESMRQERAAQSEKLNTMEAAAVAQIKRAYEEKLRRIESTLQEVVKERDVYARTMADKIARKVGREMEESFQRRLSEYKSSINAMSERESAMQVKVAALMESRGKLEEELAAMRSEKERYLSTVKAWEEDRTDLLSILATEKRKTKELNARLIAMEETREAEAATTKENHEKTLREIDEKIRRLLDAKTLEVKKYRELYESERHKVRELEEMVAEVNRQLRA